MGMDRLHELAALVRSRLGDGPQDGTAPMLLPGISILASDIVTDAQQIVYEPMLCVILEGAKQTTLGSESHSYRAGDYLVVSADLPVSGQVLTAPYLALGLPLDPATAAELLIETEGGLAADETPIRGLAVSAMDAEMVDTVTRLVRLLDRPGDAAVLAPMIRRELLWRLMQGEHAAMVRQIAAVDGRLAQVKRAIRWIRTHYAEPMTIGGLAALAGMSETSLHRHFKAVTSMSPLQYQKQVRLQEARNRLLGQGGDIAGVGFAVGYDSPSQFSREYSRQFGRPPGRDLERLRADPSLAAVV